jgi:hypothetical protein
MVPYERICPMADTGRAARAARAGPTAAVRLVIGLVLVLFALVLFAASRVITAGQRHAYDPGATPPAIYTLTAGKVYQLSTPGGVPKLTKSGLSLGDNSLSCTASAEDGRENPLSIQSTKNDDRDLTVFATFQAASTGPVHISCVAISKVFVDDADSASRDTAGLLVVLCTGLGVLGVIAVASGGYALSTERSERQGAIPPDGTELPML